jgi:hypothetical protein
MRRRRTLQQQLFQEQQQCALPAAVPSKTSKMQCAVVYLVELFHSSDSSPHLPELLLMLHRGLAISSSEEQLALSLLGGPAFTLALNNQELMKTDEMNFELLGPGVHTAGEKHSTAVLQLRADSAHGAHCCVANHARAVWPCDCVFGIWHFTCCN